MLPPHIFFRKSPTGLFLIEFGILPNGNIFQRRFPRTKQFIAKNVRLGGTSYLWGVCGGTSGQLLDAFYLIFARLYVGNNSEETQIPLYSKYGYLINHIYLLCTEHTQIL